MTIVMYSYAIKREKHTQSIMEEKADIETRI